MMMLLSVDDDVDDELMQPSKLTFFAGGPVGPVKLVFFQFWWPETKIYWPEKNKEKQK